MPQWLEWEALCTTRSVAIEEYLSAVHEQHTHTHTHTHTQDAVYVELAGGHANEEEEAAANQLVTSLMSARHPLDLKMKHAEVALVEGGVPLLGEEVKGEVVRGERVRRAVPMEGGDSGGEADLESDSEGEKEEEEEEESGENSGETQDQLTLCVMKY